MEKCLQRTTRLFRISSKRQIYDFRPFLQKSEIPQPHSIDNSTEDFLSNYP